MVAKLKSSFLKSSFQLFCHKNLFNNGSNTTSIQSANSTKNKRSLSNSSKQQQQQQQQQQPSKQHLSDTKNLNSENKKKTLRSSSASSTPSIGGSQSSPVKPIQKSESFHSETKKSEANNMNYDNNHDNTKVNLRKNRSKSSTSSSTTINNSNNSANINNIHINTTADNYYSSNGSRFSYPAVHLAAQIVSDSNSSSNDFYDNANLVSNLLPISANNTNNSNSNKNELTLSSSSSSSPSSLSSSSNIPTNSNTMSTNNNLVKASLYNKNSKSIAELKLAKKLQLIKQSEDNMNSNNNNNNTHHQISSNDQKKQFVNQMPGILNTNKSSNLVLVSTSIRKYNTTNATNNSNGDFLTRLNDQLFMKNSMSNNNVNSFSHKQRLYASSNTNTKKVVRFADALGLELENIITLNSSDNSLNSARRKLRLNHQPSTLSNHTHQVHHINPTHLYSSSTTNISKNVNNANQFESSSNEACLYDDIINQLAFVGDNRSRYSSHYSAAPQTNKPVGNYVNESFDFNNMNNSKRYLFINNNQYVNMDKSNQFGSLNGNLVNTTNNNNTTQQAASNITTITTRLNNGKLESEV